MDRPVRGIDILALIFAMACLVEAVIGLLMQPTYLKMFAEFGSAIPFFTRLMLRPGTMIVAGLLPLGLVIEGVFKRRSEFAMLVRCAIAMGCALLLIVAFIAAIYLPIFSISGSVN